MARDDDRESGVAYTGPVPGPFGGVFERRSGFGYDGATWWYRLEPEAAVTQWYGPFDSLVSAMDAYDAVECQRPTVTCAWGWAIAFALVPWLAIAAGLWWYWS